MLVWLCVVSWCAFWTAKAIETPPVGVEVVYTKHDAFRSRTTLDEFGKSHPKGCMMYLLHAVNNVSVLNDTWTEQFLRHQNEWAQLEPSVCFLTLYPEPPAVLPDWSENATATDLRHEEERTMINVYRARFDMLLEMIRRITTKQLRTYFWWIMYSDIDVVFTNKRKLPSGVLQRVDASNANYNSTTEATWCGDGNVPACDPNMDAKAKRREIALLIGTDQFPFTQGVLNTGVFFTSLSPVSQFILEATVRLFNVTLPSTSFDAMDQGRLSWVLQEAFNLNHDVIRSLFAPLNSTILTPACLGDQVLLSRKFDLPRALANPLLAEAAHKYFPTGTVPTGVADKVAVVCGKWFNSGACLWQGRFLKRQELSWFSCGDFAAHFYGCQKHFLESSHWRHEVARRECRSYFPWQTNADKSTFSWKTFLRESRDHWAEGGVFEPLFRPWLAAKPRCDSWDCISWGLENSPRHTDKAYTFRYKGDHPALALW
eukprot:Gregarina_sp_Pseudo_9__2288@NODE_260_length_3370_cov_67_237766_g243_i0_p1_GENE_NODE_260_length_3370_cov_67_237766_g243_i0NODE_260_length_3370_cov_67_237766_g243_i0_p1_ORF_typecomplete_len486_score111_43Glyco_transf_34/PF05637_12/1_8e03Glyco_transf_34/PF05637_12/0_00026_NODE_260_length_3370_cov_67_237766_g243_i02531710